MKSEEIMNGWSAILGGIFSNNRTRGAGLTQSVKKTAHFQSLCGTYYVDFTECEVGYLKQISTSKGTIFHQGIEFEYVKTSFR